MSITTVIHRCRRCEKEQPASALRYIRMRTIRVGKATQWVRETTTTPTEIGPYCPSCLPGELDPA